MSDIMLGMTTWTLRQIDQVRGLRAKAEVDLQLWDQPGVQDGTKHELVRVLSRMAHPFAVEVHGDDFRTSASPTERFTMEVGCWWEPTTTTVELRGGPHDGTVLEFAKAPRESLVMPAPPQPPMWDETYPSEPLPQNPRYDLATRRGRTPLGLRGGLMTCRWDAEAAEYLADGEACRGNRPRRARNGPCGDAHGRAGGPVHRRSERPLDRLNRNSEVREGE